MTEPILLERSKSTALRPLRSNAPLDSVRGDGCNNDDGPQRGLFKEGNEGYGGEVGAGDVDCDSQLLLNFRLG